MRRAALVAVATGELEHELAVDSDKRVVVLRGVASLIDRSTFGRGRHANLGRDAVKAARFLSALEAACGKRSVDVRLVEVARSSRREHQRLAAGGDDDVIDATAVQAAT